MLSGDQRHRDKCCHAHCNCFPFVLLQELWYRRGPARVPRLWSRWGTGWDGAGGVGEDGAALTCQVWEGDRSPTCSSFQLWLLDSCFQTRHRDHRGNSLSTRWTQWNSIFKNYESVVFFCSQVSLDCPQTKHVQCVFFQDSSQTSRPKLSVLLSL